MAPLLWLSGGVAGSTSMAATATRPGRFTVTSPALKDGGTLPVRFTCDGSSVNPPIRWSGAPKGTRSYAVVMHHVPGPRDVHWYWVVYGIPANTTALAEASTSVGSLGTNSVNGRNEYTPPCSKGPGPKAYILTVYALSKAPTFGSDTSVNREVLLSAIAKTTLATSTLTVTYSRSGTVTGRPNGGSGAPPPKPPVPVGTG